jgi:hypothetical protein
MNRLIGERVCCIDRPRAWNVKRGMDEDGLLHCDELHDYITTKRELLRSRNDTTSCYVAMN